MRRRSVRSAAFSPDGKRVVTNCEDETARVWNAETGALVLERKGNSFGVNAVAFSADGTRIATVSGRLMPTVKVWDAEKISSECSVQPGRQAGRHQLRRRDRESVERGDGSA